MKISTKGKYGLKAIVDIAVNSQNGKSVSIKSISNRQGISENYLEQIISNLKKAGILNSIRGANGGYYLTNPPNLTTVGDVLRVLEGPLLPSYCVLNPSEDSCGDSDCSTCSTREVWIALFNKINEVLDSITINDLAKDPKPLILEDF